MRRFLSLLFLICFSTHMYGVSADPAVVRRLQPDGSVVVLRMHGDERFHYCTTLAGIPVCQGADGFYYVADLQQGLILPSRQRVGHASGQGVWLPDHREDPVLTALRQQGWTRWEAAAVSSDCRPARSWDVSSQAIRVLVLPVNFEDVSFSMTDPQAYFDHLLNVSRGLAPTPSAKSYFEENLGGSVEIRFDVAEPISLSHPRSYYGGNDATGQDEHPSRMVEEACRLAVQQGVDLAEYDLDQDGELDYLFVYYAGHNEAEGGPDGAIWPHAHSLADAGLVLQGIRIGPYACTSELRGGYGLDYAGIGTFCHEFAHLLGLVDLYDTDGPIGGNYGALWGTMALMNHGAYNNNGHTPPNFCAVDLDLLGLAEYIPVREGEEVVLPGVSSTHTIGRLDTQQPGEYFLFEMRNNTGWDEYIGGMGMLVYHIDKSDQVADGIRASKRWEINRVNGSSVHPCADLVEAKEKATDFRQLFFPGSAQVFSLSSRTRPALVSWTGEACGVGLDSIRLAYTRDYVSFLGVKDLGYALPRVVRHQAVSYQQALELSWYTDMHLEVDWVVEWRTVTDVYFQNVTVSESEYRIEGLKSDETYLIRLTPRTKKYVGETYEFDVRTAELTAPFPAIAGMEKTYFTGDYLNLQVVNLVEPVSRIRWLVNNRLMSESSMMLMTPGRYDIRAEITYEADGAKEYLYKTIQVQLREEAHHE